MSLVTVGSKYQIVIPKEVRKKVRNIRPGAKVEIYALDTKSIKMNAGEQDWIKRTYGMMSKAWGGIDPIKELEKMRNEWEK